MHYTITITNNGPHDVYGFLLQDRVSLPATSVPLSATFGRRNYFVASVALFTLSSGLCGMATSLEQLVTFRLLQGFLGGAINTNEETYLYRKMATVLGCHAIEHQARI